MKLTKSPQINIAAIFFSLMIILTITLRSHCAQPDYQSIYIEITQKLFPDNLRKSQSVAICPFNYSSNGIKPFARLVTERLTNTIAASKKCIVVERSNLNQLMSETKMALTGAINQDSAVKIGNLLGAKLVVIGTIEKDETGLQIISRLVNVETGKIESTAEVGNIAIPKRIDEPKQASSSQQRTDKKDSLWSSFLYLDDADEVGDIITLIFKKPLWNILISLTTKIEQQGDELRKQLALLYEQTRPGQTAEDSSKKSLLEKRLKAADIMMNGIDAISIYRDEDTFKASLKQARYLDPDNENYNLLYVLFEFHILGIENIAEKMDTIKIIIDRILSKDPDNAFAYYFRTSYYRSTIDSIKKKSYFAMLHEKPKLTPVLKKQLAEAAKKFYASIDSYISKSNDRMNGYGMKLYYILTIERLMGMEKYVDADTLLKKVVNDDNKLYLLYAVRAQYLVRNYSSDLGRGLFSANKNSKKYKEGVTQINHAIEDYSMLVSMDPRGIAGRFQRAEIYLFYKGEPNKAVLEYTALLELDPVNASKYYYHRGKAYKKLGLQEKMKKDYLASVEKDPRNIDALNALQRIFEKEDNIDEYLNYGERIIEILKGKKVPYYHLIKGEFMGTADMLAKKERCSEAVLFYQKAWDADNTDKKMNAHLPDKQDNFFLWYPRFTTWAECYDKLGQPDKAMEKYNKGIMVLNDEIARRTKKISKKSKREKDDDIQLHLARGPLSALYFSLGNHYYNLNKFNEALESYEKCLSNMSNIVNNRLAPQSRKSSSYYNRALCYEELGQLDKALAEMTKACNLGLKEACKHVEGR